MSPRYLPSSVSSIRLSIRDWCRLNNFKRAAMGHLGYLNETTLAFWISMSSRYLPSGFSSIPLSVLGKISFKEFQDGRHLGYRNGTNWAILNLHVARYFPSSISSIRLSVREMSFKEFQDGTHLGFRNGTNWAVLNFHVGPIPPIKFQLNLTFRSRDVFWRISRFAPSWIPKRNEFNNYESSCRPDTSHQISAQSDFPLAKRCR